MVTLSMHDQRSTVVVLPLLAIALLHAPALAQEASSGRDEEARALFEAGQVAFEDGRFEDAEGHFRRSYELSQRVELLYNVAVAADHARHDQAALQAYEEYLQRVPDTERRTRVETRIAALRAGGASAEGALGLGDERAPSGGSDPAPWIVFGISAAALVAGGVMVGIAAVDADTVNSAPMDTPWVDVAEAYDRSVPLAIAGYVVGGVGLLGMVVSLVWGLSSGGGGSSTALRFGPGSLTFMSRF